MDPTLGFLLDEHVDPILIDALRRRVAGLRISLVGRPGAPPRGTPDPELLRWIELHDCVLVSSDRTSLPHHLADHLAAGRHVPGVVVLPRQFPGWARIAEDLELLWGAAGPSDRVDRVVYLPL